MIDYTKLRLALAALDGPGTSIYDDGSMDLEEVVLEVRALLNQVDALNAPQAPPPPDNTTVEWVYSNNEETYNSEKFASIEDAIAGYMNEFKDEEDSVYIGRVAYINPARYISIRLDSMLDWVNEDVTDNVGESGEGWPKLSNEQLAGLKTLVTNYILHHSPVNFFAVGPVRRYGYAEAKKLIEPTQVKSDG